MPKFSSAGPRRPRLTFRKAWASVASTLVDLWRMFAGIAKLYLGKEDEAVAWLRRAALSRCQGKNAIFHDLSGCQAAATAVRHVVIAAARSARCVWAERRWRWTLKVL